MIAKRATRAVVGAVSSLIEISACCVQWVPITPTAEDLPNRFCVASTPGGRNTKAAAEGHFTVEIATELRLFSDDLRKGPRYASNHEPLQQSRASHRLGEEHLDEQHRPRHRSPARHQWRERPAERMR